MSAFAVPHSHITAIVNFLVDTLGLKYSSAEQIGQTLTDENCKSVAYRYSEPISLERFIYSSNPNRSSYSPVQIIKAVRCLQYQSCEHPDWSESLACQILRRTGNLALSLVIQDGEMNWHCLNGYDQAEWVID